MTCTPNGCENKESSHNFSILKASFKASGASKYSISNLLCA